MKRWVLTACCLALAAGMEAACSLKNSTVATTAQAVYQEASPAASQESEEEGEGEGDAWVRIRSAEGAELVIKSPKDANKAAGTLSNAPFANAMVSMARPPDYYVDVGTENGTYGYAILDIYEVWISPQKNSLEIVKSATSQYVHLTAEESKPVLKILKSL